MKYQKLSSRKLSPKFYNFIKKSATIVFVAIMAAALSACASSGASSTAASTATPTSSAVESAAAQPSSAASTGESSKKIRTGMLERNSIEEGAINKWLPPEVGNDLTDHIQFPSFNAALLALEAGKLDLLSIPQSVCNYLAATNSRVKFLKQPTRAAVDFYMATLAENTKLSEELSSAIDALKADGTIAKLAQEFLGDNAKEPAPITLIKKDGGETYKVAITGDMPPLDYIAADGTPAGFNVALLNAISEKTGCNFEIVQVEAAARLSALKSGKADVVFWISCISQSGSTPDGEEVVLTPPYYSEPLGAVSYSQEKLDEAYEIVDEALAIPAASSAAP